MDILAVIVTSAFSNGIVVFLLNKWIEHSFSARLAEIEVKNKILAYEHQVRFTRFDERVASAIEGAYEIVCEYSDALKGAVRYAYDEKGDAGKDSLAQTEKIAHKFRSYMQRQSIYLPPDLAEKLHDTRLALRDSLTEELIESRAYKDRNGKPTTILVGLYKNAGLQEKLDELMVELQEMVRGHLNQFVIKN